jgi:hypothetical protein
MKLNKKTLAAINPKNHKAIKALPMSKPAKPATPAKAARKAKKTGKAAKAVKGKLTKQYTAVALLSGARGTLARAVRVFEYVTGQVEIIALQNNLGLAEKNPVPCAIIGGKLVGDKLGRVQLGGYVNGRNTGASVKLITEAQFLKASAPCVVHWDKDGVGVHGRYIGQPNEKGICAVACKFGAQWYFWQMEIDSNVNNKHERGDLKPIGNQPLKAVTYK